MSIDRVILKLKRLERKKWQFEDEAPKCVELAVLDYYNAQGWQGYFTEKVDHFALLSFVTGWGDWANKRPRSLSSIYDLLERNGYDRTINNIKNTNIDNLKINLYTAAKHTKDKYQLSPLEQNAHRIDEFIEELLSFYHCVGSEGLVDRISFLYPKGRVANLKKIQKFDSKLSNLMFANRSESVVSPELAIWIARAKWEEDEKVQCRVEKIMSFVRKFADQSFIDAAEETTDLARRELSRLKEITSVTMLDLVVWKYERIAYIEVKAPRDKLFQSQINTLNKYEEEGVAAWVVDVVEA